jgi:hypothetical protein
MNDWWDDDDRVYEVCRDEMFTDSRQLSLVGCFATRADAIAAAEREARRTHLRHFVRRRHFERIGEWLPPSPIWRTS